MPLLLLQDLEEDYNPQDLAKILLGQNPELLQNNISIQPAVSRSVNVVVHVFHKSMNENFEE